MIDLLESHIRNHVTLSTKTASRLQEYFTENKVNKKEYLLKAGDISRHEFFIVKGCLRTFVIDPNGAEHNVLFGTENWWVGDYASFSAKTPASYFIQALENTEVLAINRNDWTRLFAENKELQPYLITLFENAVIDQQRRIAKQISYTGEQKYLEFLEKRLELSQRISQKHIASYLGITPEFLSMIRKKLSNR